MNLDNLEAALEQFIFDCLATSTFKAESQIAVLDKVTRAALDSNGLPGTGDSDSE